MIPSVTEVSRKCIFGGWRVLGAHMLRAIRDERALISQVVGTIAMVEYIPPGTFSNVVEKLREKHLIPKRIFTLIVKYADEISHFITERVSVLKIIDIISDTWINELKKLAMLLKAEVQKRALRVKFVFTSDHGFMYAEKTIRIPREFWNLLCLELGDKKVEIKQRYIRLKLDNEAEKKRVLNFLANNDFVRERKLSMRILKLPDDRYCSIILFAPGLLAFSKELKPMFAHGGVSLFETIVFLDVFELKV